MSKVWSAPGSGHVDGLKFDLVGRHDSRPGGWFLYSWSNLLLNHNDKRRREIERKAERDSSNWHS